MKKYHKKLVSILALLAFLMSVTVVKSQEETEVEKLNANMYLEYHKKADGTEGVKVKITYKENRKHLPVAGAMVNLYLEEISKQGMITNIMTDENGEGFILFNERFYKNIVGKYSYHLIGRMASEPKFEETEEELTITPAQIVLVSSQTDEGNEISASVSEIIGEGELAPVADAEIKFYIQRMFSLLPIGEEYLTTDEDGMVSVIIPSDLPGDKEGNIIIIARMEEHEDYGNIAVQQTEAWGIPLVLADMEERTLWSKGNNAPIPLVVASVTIVFAIWGILFYLFFQLYNIKKEGKKEMQIKTI